MKKREFADQLLAVFCQFILLFIGCFDGLPLPGSTETPRLRLLNMPVSYSSITQACQETLGSGWRDAVPTAGLSMQRLHDVHVTFLKTHQLSTVWFPVKRIKFNTWQYSSGNRYDGEVSGFFSCGSLNAKYGTIEGRDCSAAHHGFVCQVGGCVYCPPYLSPYSCLRINSKCFLLGCDAGSWYDARNRCYDFNMELAEVRSPDEAFLLADAIKRVPTRKCQHYWLGLRKEDSVLDAQGYPVIYETYWDQDEPKPGHECTVLRKTDKGYFWDAVSCEEEHVALCMEGPLLVTVP